MLTLGALRYRNISATAGGPIVRVETADLRLEGMRVFQANTFLRPDLTPPRRHLRQVYGGASGSGTHRSPLIARHMAISEALERWAYASVICGSAPQRFGFDVDPMSNGMAAFPGWRARQARPMALREAIERHALISWWEGRLAATPAATPWPGIDAVVLGQDSAHVTVLLHKHPTPDRHAYGHATGTDFDSTCRKALVELARHEQVIEAFYVRQRLTGTAQTVSNLLERRAIYFASEQGREEVLQRLHTPPQGPPPARRIAFDGAIPGPWSVYADVWRVVYHPPSSEYLRETERYFLW